MQAFIRALRRALAEATRDSMEWLPRIRQYPY